MPMHPSSDLEQFIKRRLSEEDWNLERRVDMATPPSSPSSSASAAFNGEPQEVVATSSLNTVAMSHTTETEEVNPSSSTSSEQPSGSGGDGQHEAETSSGGAPTTGGTGSSRDAEGVEATETIARGIASVLGPVVRMFETRVDEVLQSQSTLESSIGRLTRELDKLLEDTPLPLGAQQAAKLSGIRKRVGSLTATLQIIQSRINNMDHMLSKESVESLS